MVLYICLLAGDRMQKFGYSINAIFRFSLFFGAKTAKNSGGTAGVFAVFTRQIPRDPGFLPNTTPRSLIIPGKNSENSETVASNLHEAHPKTPSRVPSPGPVCPLNRASRACPGESRGKRLKPGGPRPHACAGVPRLVSGGGGIRELTQRRTRLPLQLTVPPRTCTCLPSRPRRAELTH